MAVVATRSCARGVKVWKGRKGGPGLHTRLYTSKGMYHPSWPLGRSSPSFSSPPLSLGICEIHVILTKLCVKGASHLPDQVACTLRMRWAHTAPPSYNPGQVLDRPFSHLVLVSREGKRSETVRWQVESRRPFSVPTGNGQLIFSRHACSALGRFLQ